MIREFKFTKEYNPSQWFVELPDYTGPRADLEMVLGADLLCQLLAQGEDEVTMSLDTKEFPGHRLMLEYQSDEADGGWYEIVSNDPTIPEFPVWLCKVTKFVFGELPLKIYVA